MLSESITRLSKRIVWISLLLTIYFTLFPFDFFFNKPFSPIEILRSFDLSVSSRYAVVDFPRNVAFFIPLGFGLAGWFAGKKVRKIWAYPLVVLIGTGLSFTAEVLQSYTLDRFPTFADVLANGFGTAVGLVIFHLFGVQLLQYTARLLDRLRSFFTFKRALPTYLLYILLWLFVANRIQTVVQLNNWDTSYPLLIGNEASQDRPWSGTIQQVQLYSRALPGEEVARLFDEDAASPQDDNALVAFYDFTGDGQGNFPPLVWQRNGEGETADDGIHVSQDQWLESQQPVTAISQAVADSSQFTVEIVAASAGPDQTGPARILSISQDPFLRNLTIGQEQTDLTLRFRTPLTGENGRHPELIIHDVFTDQNFHQIVITYDGRTVTFYMDNPANPFTVELAPSLAIFTRLFPAEVDQLRISHSNTLVFRLVFDMLIFLPLALLALIWSRSQPAKDKNKFILAAIGFIVVSLLWEFLLGRVISSYDVNVGNMLLDAAITAVGFLFLYK
ncbi:MAG: VanZ family protein [Candidatus Promineifilaceae bacterium]